MIINDSPTGLFVKENLVSTIAFINLYNIAGLILIITYILFFGIPFLTGFFTDSSNQVSNLPYLAWHIPSFLAFCFGFGFALESNETYTLPLVGINFIGFVCHLICITFTSGGLIDCVASSYIDCSIVDVVALTFAFILFIAFIVVDVLLIISYLIFSNTIRNAVDAAITNAKRVIEQNQMEQQVDDS